VNQTAEDLLSDGVEVHVVQDAVTSRTADNRTLGLHKMERSGATVTSVETALFELLKEAGTPEFKEVQALVK
jgi:nicotinamidase-related amidase